MNKAVLQGYQKGFLTSTSICANGEEFDAAVNEIIPECPNLGIGVHLNIMEGKALFDNTNFHNGYLQLILKAKNKFFIDELEKEFRLQIEKTLKFTKVSHIDSHVHVHAIPEIFELTCKLANEYGIKQVRTQFENFYTVPSISKHLSLKYPPNLLKIALLNSFTVKNKEKITEYNLTTNDYIIGVGYTGMMDDKTLYWGLNSIKDENAIVEALIHPCVFEKSLPVNQHEIEFKITQNADLKDKIQRLGDRKSTRLNSSHQ